jgi:hypothetical protein
MDPAATAALYASHVLKDGDSFLVANGYGDIEEGSTGPVPRRHALVVDVPPAPGGDAARAAQRGGHRTTTCSSWRT